jgi:peptidoglycan L-alanyl-D-glutamate endopeptidase CwlK
MALSDRDRLRLVDVHPKLTALIERVFTRMNAAGHPMFVVMGVRTASQQQALYAQGRTKPGKIVTMLDGVKKPSNHQVKADGLGHAVDCAFLTGEAFGEHQPWSIYGSACKAEAGLLGISIVWGGDWQTPVDRPHVELTQPATKSV